MAKSGAAGVAPAACAASEGVSAAGVASLLESSADALLASASGGDFSSFSSSSSGSAAAACPSTPCSQLTRFSLLKSMSLQCCMPAFTACTSGKLMSLSWLERESWLLKSSTRNAWHHMLCCFELEIRSRTLLPLKQAPCILLQKMKSFPICSCLLMPGSIGLLICMMNLKAAYCQSPFLNEQVSSHFKNFERA